MSSEQVPTEKKRGTKAIVLTFLFSIAATLGVYLIVKPPAQQMQLLDKEQTGEEIAQMVNRAYGGGPSYFTDDTVRQLDEFGDRVCQDLLYDQPRSFRTNVLDTEWHQLVAAANVLYSCANQQDKAMDWGLSESVFRRLPLK